MSDDCVIEGDYADFKIVRTRQVCQIVVEVPIEKAGEVSRLLGFPLPGTNTRCAVVRLNLPGAGASTAARERVGDASTREDEDRVVAVASSPTRTNSQRAFNLLRNSDFRRFVSALVGDKPPTVTTEDQADRNLKKHFGISSKAQLDDDPYAGDWQVCLLQFKAFQQAQGHGVI